jgi:hypothetical protein
MTYSSPGIDSQIHSIPWLSMMSKLVKGQTGPYALLGLCLWSLLSRMVTVLIQDSISHINKAMVMWMRREIKIKSNCQGACTAFRSPDSNTHLMRRGQRLW